MFIVVRSHILGTCVLVETPDYLQGVSWVWESVALDKVPGQLFTFILETQMT